MENEIEGHAPRFSSFPAPLAEAASPTADYKHHYQDEPPRTSYGGELGQYRADAGLHTQLPPLGCMNMQTQIGVGSSSYHQIHSDTPSSFHATPRSGVSHPSHHLPPPAHYPLSFTNVSTGHFVPAHDNRTYTSENGPLLDDNTSTFTHVSGTTYPRAVTYQDEPAYGHEHRLPNSSVNVFAGPGVAYSVQPLPPLHSIPHTLPGAMPRISALAPVPRTVQGIGNPTGFSWRYFHCDAKVVCDGNILTPDIYVKMERPPMRDTEYFCYRRNYFDAQVSYSIDPPQPQGHLYLDGTRRVKAIAVRVVATIDGQDGKTMQLVQYTTKRDKGPITPIRTMPIAPVLPRNFDSPYLQPHSAIMPQSTLLPAMHPNPFNPPTLSGPALMPDLPTQHEADPGIMMAVEEQKAKDAQENQGGARGVNLAALIPGVNHEPTSQGFNFERMQFKTATQNNGKRRATQQFYVLSIELRVDIRPEGASEPQWVTWATRSSERVVCRGRSPNHYTNGQADRLEDPLTGRKDPHRKKQTVRKGRKGPRGAGAHVGEDVLVQHFDEHGQPIAYYGPSQFANATTPFAPHPWVTGSPSSEYDRTERGSYSTSSGSPGEPQNYVHPVSPSAWAGAASTLPRINELPALRQRSPAGNRFVEPEARDEDATRGLVGDFEDTLATRLVLENSMLAPGSFSPDLAGAHFDSRFRRTLPPLDQWHN